MAKVGPSAVKKAPPKVAPVKTKKTEHMKMRIPKMNRVHQVCLLLLMYFSSHCYNIIIWLYTGVWHLFKKILSRHYMAPCYI